MKKSYKTLENIGKSIRHIKEHYYDEPGLMILNKKTYKKLHKEFGKQGLLIHPSQIFGIPFIIINMKESCLVLSKSAVELIKKTN